MFRKWIFGPIAKGLANKAVKMQDNNVIRVIDMVAKNEKIPPAEIPLRRREILLQITEDSSEAQRGVMFESLDRYEARQQKK